MLQREQRAWRAGGSSFVSVGSVAPCPSFGHLVVRGAFASTRPRQSTPGDESVAEGVGAARHRVWRAGVFPTRRSQAACTTAWTHCVACDAVVFLVEGYLRRKSEESSRIRCPHRGRAPCGGGHGDCSGARGGSVDVSDAHLPGVIPTAVPLH